MKNSEYSLKLKTAVQPIIPGQETALILTPEKPFELEMTHERKIHLIIVSEDLSYFNHIHPQEYENNYSVKTKFPSPGEYYLFADYKPYENDQVVDKFELNITGDTPFVQEYHDEKLTGSSGPYSISLVTDGDKFGSGHLMADVILKKEGKNINPATLDDYLGAKAHVVIISVDDKAYIHVHPAVENEKYKLHISFPKAGFYKGWIQFQAEGKVHTIDFVIKVVD